MASFIKDVRSAGFSNGMAMLCSLIGSIIIARVLGPEKNGIIATLVVYPTLFMSFGGLGISEAVTHLLGRNIIPEKQIRVTITQIWVFTSLIGIVLCFLLMSCFNNSNNELYLIILALIPIPLTLYKDYFSGVFLAKGDISFFNRIYWIPKVIALVLIITLVLWLMLDVVGVLIALIGGPLFMCIVLFFRYDGDSSFNPNIKWATIKRLLGLGSIYALATLLIQLNLKLDIILLDYLSTPYEVGIYTKGMGITEYLWQIPTVFNHVIMHRSTVAKDGKAFSLKMTQLLRLSFLAIILASIVLYTFSELVIVGLYGEAFRESIPILKILLPGIVLLSFYKVMSTDLAGKGKPWIILKAMIIALPINIFSNLFFIPEYGSVGAAVSSTISYSFAAILFLHLYSREVAIPIKIILGFKTSDFIPIIELLKKLKK